MPDQLTPRRVSSLLPDARNARTHSDEQVGEIAALIKEFGWTNPILIDGDSKIIAGHGRVMAAHRLGLQSVPCIILKHLSPMQRRAYALADNKIAINADWNEELLRKELAEIAIDPDLFRLTGFTEEELESLAPVPLPADGGQILADETPSELTGLIAHFKACGDCGFCKTARRRWLKWAPENDLDPNTGGPA